MQSIVYLNEHCKAQTATLRTSPIKDEVSFKSINISLNLIPMFNSTEDHVITICVDNKWSSLPLIYCIRGNPTLDNSPVWTVQQLVDSVNKTLNTLFKNYGIRQDSAKLIYDFERFSLVRKTKATFDIYFSTKLYNKIPNLDAQFQTYSGSANYRILRGSYTYDGEIFNKQSIKANHVLYDIKEVVIESNIKTGYSVYNIENVFYKFPILNFNAGRYIHTARGEFYKVADMKEIDFTVWAIDIYNTVLPVKFAPEEGLTLDLLYR